MAGVQSQAERIVYSVDKTFVKLGSNTNKEENLYGTLLVLEKEDGCYIEWRQDESEQSDGANDGWDVINPNVVSFTSQSKQIELKDVAQSNGAPSDGTCTISNHQKFHNQINFHVANLRSFKRIKGKLRQHSCVIFILDCGTTHHPIYFPKGGIIEKFLNQLEKKVIVKQSTSDRNLFLVSTHQSDALETSFDALDLFSDQGSALQRFAAHPVRNTFSAFAKVSALLSDALVASEDRDSVAPEFCDQLRTSIDEGESDLPTVNSSQIEDPDFLFVDEKPQLPEVELKPRDKAVSKTTWDECFDADGRALDPSEIRKMVYRGGISHDVRREAWKFLLSFYPWDSTAVEREDLRKIKVDEYFAMKLQWKSMAEYQKSRFVAFRDRESLIEKDVKRTDRTTPFFSGENNEKLQQLNDILMTYVMYNFDLGYVQGMSDLLSPILLVMDNEVDAFWCFVGFMDLVHTNFEMDQEGMKLQLNQLNQIVQVVDRKLYSYLDTHESSNMYFAFRWLLILFKREFSMSDIMRLWEVMWTGLPCKNYQLIIATAILCQSTNVIIESQFNFNEILKHINDQSGNIVLADILMQSEALAQQLLTCENLPSYVSKIITNTDLETSPSSYDIAQGSADATLTGNKPPRPAYSPAAKGDT